MLCCEESLKSYKETFLVACGDVPLLSASSFKIYPPFILIIITVLQFYLQKLTIQKGYGRLIRNEAGVLQQIVEEKDITDEERKSK